MSEVRLLNETEFKAFVEITGNAYPAAKANTPEEKQKLEETYIRMQKEVPYVNFYGCFRNGKPLGVMRFHDFMMNFNSHEVKAGGIGFVAVDLMHKKEKIAKDIVSAFLNHYRDSGALFAMLYAFRPDFYRDMGFGLGAKVSQYRVKPADLPKGKGKEYVGFFTSYDKTELMDFFHRRYRKVHGMIRREEFELNNLINYPDNKLVVYKKDGTVQGFMVFTFRKPDESNFLLTDIYIRELQYENTDAMMGLLAFLNSQQDQIRNVVINSHDDYLNYIFRDPRNCSDNVYTPVYHESNLQELGVMYRVVNTAGVFKEMKNHSFGRQNCRLKLTVEDGFLQQNNGSIVVHFRDGYPELVSDGAFDAELKMGIADFSSMLMGVISLKKLLGYGLAEISEPGCIDIADSVFRCEEKPVCLSQF